MAFISQGSTENIVLGEGYSPFAVNSNDVYLDSTSYILGIGNTNPDTLLHLTGASGAHIKIDDAEASNNNPITVTNATGTGLAFASTNGDGSGNSTLTWSFTNDRASGGTSILKNVADTATGLYLTDGSQGLKIDQNTANRRIRYRDYGGGNGAGCFNMEYNDSGSGTAQAYFSFGYGDEAHTYDARLAIKDANMPQLKLHDGTNYHALESVGDEFFIYNDSVDTSANTYLQLTSTSLNMRGGSTSGIDVGFAAGDPKIGGNSQALQIYNGLRWGIQTVSAASVSLTVTSGPVIWVTRTASGACTINLPVVLTDGNIYIIKDAGNAGTNNITVDPFGTGTIDGALTLVINEDYGSATIMFKSGVGWVTL